MGKGSARRPSSVKEKELFNNWDNIFGKKNKPFVKQESVLETNKKGFEMIIDRKYVINAVNPCSGNVHDNKDSVLFLAKDKAFLEGALPGYLAKCIELGANPAHIEAVELLIERVKEYQNTIESKTPDTDLPCEIDRCVAGVGVS